MAIHGLIFLLGLITLFLGADWLVRGASRIARTLGVNALLIGLTVVAMGTSAPELLVSVVAAYRGSGDIAVGNVIGSNIANIALILGLAALIWPITVQKRVLVTDIPIMIGASFLFYLLALNGNFSRGEGAAFVAVFVAYTLYLLRKARREPPTIEAKYARLISPRGTLPGHIALTILGFVALVGGAYFVVDRATVVAGFLGLSELAIGITLVAVGTSLPELATAVAASVQKEGDILVGAIVGSNIFNTSAIIGAAALVGPPDATRAVIDVEVPAMIAANILMWLLASPRRRLSRFEGVVLLAAYAAFVIWLALPY